MARIPGQRLLKASPQLIYYVNNPPQNIEGKLFIPTQPAPFAAL